MLINDSINKIMILLNLSLIYTLKNVCKYIPTLSNDHMHTRTTYTDDKR